MPVGEIFLYGVWAALSLVTILVAAVVFRRAG